MTINTDVFSNLPDGWVIASLPVLVAINPRLIHSISDDSVPVTFVPMTAVDVGFGGIQRPEQRTYGEVKKGYTPFTTGDVIFAKITPCMENGKGGVVKGEPDQPFFGSTEFHVLRPRREVNATWIAHYLSQEQFRRSARLKMKGSAGQLRVPTEFLESVSIPLPPSAEQVRILDLIEELFTDLDAGVAALVRVQKKLKRYRAALLHAAVTGRLTADWRAMHGDGGESGAKLLERIQIARRQDWEERTLAEYNANGNTPPKGWQSRYKEAEKPDISELATLPVSWIWVTLDQIANVTGGVAKNKKAESGSGRTEIAYLRVANVQRGFLDLEQIKTIRATDTDVRQLQLRPGDILMTEGGDRDKLGRGWIWEGQITNCIHQNHVFRARLLSNDCEPRLVSHAANGYGREWFMQNGVQSVNLASISLGQLRRFPVPLAPRDEQLQIADAISEKLSSIDSMEMEVVRGLRRAARLRQAILKVAFEGKLVPQNPNDEPASELLARIQAEAVAEANSSTKRTPSKRKTTKKKSTKKATT
jgi:type I restriction enzyme S subunit